MFDVDNEGHKSAIQLYIHAKNQVNVPLYGLTLRALIILSYRVRQMDIVKELFERAKEANAYPEFEVGSIYKFMYLGSGNNI